MMVDPAILFVKPKAISAADKKWLENAGVIVVEVDDPASVKLVRPCAELPVSEMLAMACDVLSGISNGPSRDAFAKRICDAIVARQKAARAAGAADRG